MNHNLYVALSFLPDVKEAGSQVVRRYKRGWLKSVYHAVKNVVKDVVSTVVHLACKIPGIDALCRRDSRDNRIPPGTSAVESLSQR